MDVNPFGTVRFLKTMANHYWLKQRMITRDHNRKNLTNKIQATENHRTSELIRKDVLPLQLQQLSAQFQRQKPHQKKMHGKFHQFNGKLKLNENHANKLEINFN